MEFNPNKPALIKNYFWATFIPDRRPNFKMHSNRGHALNAFQYRNKAILYKWEDDQWVEKYRIDREHGQEKCDGCGRTRGENRWMGIYRHWDDLKKEVPELITYCYECQKEYRWKKRNTTGAGQR